MKHILIYGFVRSYPMALGIFERLFTNIMSIIDSLLIEKISLSKQTILLLY